MVDEETRNNRSIEALPSPSQLDIAVLDSLPLAIKRELEVAYGAYPLKPSPLGRGHWLSLFCSRPPLRS